MATKTRHKPRRKKPREADRTELSGLPRSELLRSLAAWLTLVVAASRPLFPSEDAASGSGLLFVLLALLPLAPWAAAALLEAERIRWNYSAVDLPLAALVVWCFVSAFQAAARGPAVALALEWLGLAVLFWSVRTLVLPRLGRRPVVALFCALAIVLSVYAVYQAFWGLESLRQRFAQDRVRFLLELGIAPGSRMEQTFLNRLNSHEAFATFALANSFAGFLLPWTTLLTAAAVGLAGVLGENQRRALMTQTLRVLAAALVIVGLVLTQSRSAYLGFAVAAVPLGAYALRRFSARQVLRFGLVTLLAIAVVAAVGLVRGKFDEKLLTGAWQSLAYRLEYWKASARMVADHPLFGVGPGNFRSYYLRYKLPTSSEEITEPHNFALELAATLGIPGLALFLLVLLLVAMELLRRGLPSDDQPGSAGRRDAWFVATAAAAAAALSWWSGGAGGMLMAAIGVGTAALVAAYRYWAPSLNRLALGLGVVALLIHLLFAGGIQYPGVAIALWIGLACLLPDRQFSLGPAVLGPLVVFLLWLTGSMQAAERFVLPHLVSRARVVEARQVLAKGDLLTAIARLRTAVQAAPWDADAWALLSQLMVVQAEGGVADADQWHWLLYTVLAYQKADPASPWPCRDAALLWAARAPELGQKAWEEALRWIARARERYPTDLGIAYLEAKLLYQAGRRDEAARAAARVLEMNRRCPHPDRKLSAAQVQNLKSWSGVQKQ